MAGRTAPFAAFEWMIAWRYVRAKRAEGGVSVMTWISLIGITLAVFALIATLAVRSGFRTEFVETIIGSTAHLTLREDRMETVTVPVPEGADPVEITRRVTTLSDYEEMAARIAAVEGIDRAAGVVRGEALATAGQAQSFAQVYGISAEDFGNIPLIAAPRMSEGNIADFGEGLALGWGMARSLGVSVGDRVTLLSRTGAQTAAGQSTRSESYDVVYIFQTGRVLTDNTRIYMPLAEAQGYFNRPGQVDAIEIFVADPEGVEQWITPVYDAAGGLYWLYSWKDNEGAYLRALEVEDNVMFVILSILVLIASMNIVSGLIMLVKNKGRDIGILRTIGLSEGSVLRVFFLCGASIGTIGTLCGVILGCLFAIYIDPIFSFVNFVMGGGIWDPSIRGIYDLPAELQLNDVLSAVVLSLGLSWTITYFPARRAARMNPVEALRYE
ncbi:FtsX-like permease family protein [Aestuariibius sp. 2305UL40-4]|uniref:FtsX-like permease family protein n=1 Tax=Aestuariibius violaceus TaxID=3234132 RepID=UPI00345EAD23